MIKLLNTSGIKTVGQLRASLESIPDSALLNIGTETDGYTVNRIAYDGLSVALMTDEVGHFGEEEEHD